MKINIKVPPSPQPGPSGPPTTSPDNDPIQPAPNDSVSSALDQNDRATLVGESRMSGQAMRARLSESVGSAAGRDSVQSPSHDRIDQKMDELASASGKTQPQDTSAIEEEMENLKSGKGTSSGHSIEPNSQEYLERKMEQVAGGSDAITPGSDDSAALERELENLKAKKSGSDS